MSRQIRVPLVAGSVVALGLALLWLLGVKILGPNWGLSIALCLPAAPLVAAPIIRFLEPGSLASLAQFCTFVWVGLGMTIPFSFLLMGFGEGLGTLAFPLFAAGELSLVFCFAALGARQPCQ